MSPPRLIKPGAVLLVTRRTLRRTFLLRPDREITNLFQWLLGHLAAEHGVLIHAAIVLSTHYHIVLTDQRGEISMMMQRLDSLLARAIQVHRGWTSEVWNTHQPNFTTLRTRKAFITKTAYVLANGVAAGLVYSPGDWPGWVTRVRDLGRTKYDAAMPDFYFDPRNSQWPERSALELTWPTCLSEQDDIERLRDQIQDALDEAVKRARAAVRERGWTFLGADRVLAKSPFAAAKGNEAFGDLDPTFAVGSGEPEERRAAALEVIRFRCEYREALDRWRNGDRDVVFPAGTLKMVRLHGARAAPFA